MGANGSEVRTPVNNIEYFEIIFPQTSRGSFSAVSTPIFASKYSLELAICSKRRLKALAEIYTMHSFAPFSNLKFFVKICWMFCWFFIKNLKNIIRQNFAEFLLNFDQLFRDFPKMQQFGENPKIAHLIFVLKNI